MRELRFVIGPIAFVIFGLLVSHFGFYLSFYTPRAGLYPYKDLGTILFGIGIVIGIVGSILLVVMLVRKYAYKPPKESAKLPEDQLVVSASTSASDRCESRLAHQPSRQRLDLLK